MLAKDSRFLFRDLKKGCLPNESSNLLIISEVGVFRSTLRTVQPTLCILPEPPSVSNWASLIGALFLMRGSIPGGSDVVLVTDFVARP